MTLTFVNHDSVRVPAAEGAPAAPVRPDLRAIEAQLATLLSEENPVARRRDLAQVHKRLMDAMAELEKGMAQRTDPARAASVLKRLEALERGMTSVESALRIELEPLLQRVVADHAEQRSAQRQRLAPTILFTSVLFLAGLGLGAIYSAPILAGFTSGITGVSQVISE